MSTPSRLPSPNSSNELVPDCPCPICTDEFLIPTTVCYMMTHFNNFNQIVDYELEKLRTLFPDTDLIRHHMLRPLVNGNISSLINLCLPDLSPQDKLARTKALMEILFPEIKPDTILPPSDN